MGSGSPQGVLKKTKNVLKNKNFTTTSNVNNSVIFHCRTVPRVANERYCYIFFIFWVIWGEGVKGGPLGGTKKTKNNFFFDNSALGGHRALPKVANERYCYIFFIFRVIWGEGVKGAP